MMSCILAAMALGQHLQPLPEAAHRLARRLGWQPGVSGGCGVGSAVPDQSDHAPDDAAPLALQIIHLPMCVSAGPATSVHTGAGVTAS